MHGKKNCQHSVLAHVSTERDFFMRNSAIISPFLRRKLLHRQSVKCSKPSFATYAPWGSPANSSEALSVDDTRLAHAFWHPAGSTLLPGLWNQPRTLQLIFLKVRCWAECPSIHHLETNIKYSAERFNYQHEWELQDKSTWSWSKSSTFIAVGLTKTAKA